MKKSILITGGAGFIGANLAKDLLINPNVDKIRIIDNLSNGKLSNLKDLISNPKIEFINGDITDYNFCLKVTKGIDKVSHQAALGSVPRSIANPMKSTEVNILGTVNILNASQTNNVDRIILACSSSTYGDSQVMPRIEDKIGHPLSPYAITKYTIELYADMFKRIYNLDYIGLRYFNVFGPLQRTDSEYAAVIPNFCKSFIKNVEPVIFGNGETSRDFTYIDNIVLANKLALFTNNKDSLNQIYNVGCGESISLNQVIAILSRISGKKLNINYKQERKGDVRASRADINKIKTLLGYESIVNFEKGLLETYKYYVENVSDI